jgi:predicted small lipoprotein YifL
MRLISSFFVGLMALSALAACGTKTSLSLPPPVQAAVKATAPIVAPAVDDSNKPAAEPHQ